MAQIEPMDIDSINSEFDNKENSVHHNNVLPRTPCTEKGYEELDVSELNMKLRYSITPASSPMSKSLTVNSLDNRTFDSEDFINNVVINENCNLTRSLNSTITRNDTAKSLKSLPLQVLSTELLTENRSASVLRTIDPTSKVQDNNVTITLSGENYIDDNISLPSTSSSVAQTPEATTPTKEIQKHDGGSPIMRGLKSVLNMFRSSQSPIPPADVIVKQEILSPDETVSNIEGHKSQLVTASTPISNKVNGSQRSSPLKESIIFNDDLERELQWKDETTILFKEEKIPIHKLLLPQSLSSISKTSETASMSMKVEKENLNVSVEPMDISNNDSFLDMEVAKHIQPGVITNDLIIESDGEFVDCETTINNDISDNKIMENFTQMDNKNITLQQSCNVLLINNTQSIDSNQSITSKTFVQDCDLRSNYNKNEPNGQNEQCNDEERQGDALIKDHDVMPIAATVLLIEDQNEMSSHNIDNKRLNEIDFKNSNGPDNVDDNNITLCQDMKIEDIISDLKLPSDIPLPDEEDVDDILHCENDNKLNISNPIQLNNYELISTIEQQKINEIAKDQMNKSIVHNESSVIKENYSQCESTEIKDLNNGIINEAKVEAKISQIVNEETMAKSSIDELFHDQDINTKDTVEVIESLDKQKQLIENINMREMDCVTLITDRNVETMEPITDSLELKNDVNTMTVCTSEEIDGEEKICQNVNENGISIQNDQSMVMEDANKIVVKNETMVIENLKDDKSESVSTRKSSQTFENINCIGYPQNDNTFQLHYSEDNDIETTKILHEISSEVSSESNFGKPPQNILTTNEHTATISDCENIIIDTSNFKENGDKISDVNMDNLRKDEDELNKTLNLLTNEFALDLQKTYNTMESVEYNKTEIGIENDEKVCSIRQKIEETPLNEITNTVEDNCVNKLESQKKSNELSMNATFNMSIGEKSEIENEETKITANDCQNVTDVINSNIIDGPNIIDMNNCNNLIPSETTEYTVNQENVFACDLVDDDRVASDEINANPGDNNGENNTVLVHSAEPTTGISTTLKCENSDQVILSPERRNSSSEISSDYNKLQLNLVSVEADVMKQDHECINTSEALNDSTKMDYETNNYQAISDVITTVNCVSFGDNNEESNILSEQSACHNPCTLDVLNSGNNTEAILLPEQSCSASKNSLAINQIELNVVPLEADDKKQKHELDNMGKCLNISKEVGGEVNNVVAEQIEKIENTPLNTYQDSVRNENDNVGSEKSSEGAEIHLDVGDREKIEIKMQVSPPLSPAISSKGYNFNFDEIDDPFATKTKIRLSPPPEDVPTLPEREIKKPISTNIKKDFEKRKSLPEKKRQPLVKNKIRSSFSDAVDRKENKKCTKTTELMEVAVMNNTMVNAFSDSSQISETLISNSLEKDELVQPIQLVPCEANETDNNTDTLENNENFNISKDQLSGPTILSEGVEITSNVNEQNSLSENKHESKNVFNLPEMSTDMNFKSFVAKSNICRSPTPESNTCINSFKVPADLSGCVLKSVDRTYSESNIMENAVNKHSTAKADNDSSTASSSSKTTEDATVREVNTEDEDTVEGPFFEADDLNDDDKISDYVPDNEDMMHFTDELAQGTYDNVDNGEMFIDAEAFEFLLNQNKSNVVVDSGKESLFLKFDPLFAKRMSSDGVLAALNNVQKRQSTPKRISKAPTVDVTYCDKMSSVPTLNATTEVNNTLENNSEDPNTTSSKPMMVVNPAINSIISPRNKTIITPPRANRRSLTFTSPAIAVIDRLLSLSGNNSTLNYEASTTPVRREQHETDVALTQLRELLAEKEIHVHNLRLESKELKERLSTLETQVHSLESESGQRLRKINELNERLVEKTNINKSMAAVVEEYERTIASLIAETEQDKKRHAEERMRLISERDEQTAHLASMEISFNDLHSKYEKSKQVILSCKANEDAYRRSIKEFEESLLKMQNNYELLKQHATSKLNHANQELERLNRAHEAEVLKFNAMIKRKELHITSLEETLAQKTKANEELTAICDELINKVG